MNEKLQISIFVFALFIMMFIGFSLIGQYFRASGGLF